MATQGPLIAGTGADDATGAGGSIAWSNPENVTAEDSVYATAVITDSSESTHFLKATNFGFSIPNGAIIQGILVEIRRHASASNVLQDLTVTLYTNGVIESGTSDKGNVGVAWPTADAYASYGSGSDLWNKTWSAANINDSSFGVALAGSSFNFGIGTFSVDDIRVTITYDNTSPTTTSTSSSISTSSTSTSSTSTSSTSTSVSTSTSTSTSSSISTSSTSISSSSTSTTLPRTPFQAKGAISPSLIRGW